jgi:hypothetical protein
MNLIRFCLKKISDSITSLGSAAIPVLENVKDNTFDSEVLQRLETSFKVYMPKELPTTSSDGKLPGILTCCNFFKSSANIIPAIWI